MDKLSVIREGDAFRDHAETLIRNSYTAEYGARLQSLPPRLLALQDDSGEVICAAGLRFHDDGFFSGAYLTSPIEQMLSDISGRVIIPEEIFEVTTFASKSPRATAGFIESICRFGEANGYLWSFFTLTSRLHRLIQRMGHPLAHLADADHRRIPDPTRWGTYYASSPKVFAMPSARLDLDLDQVRGVELPYAAIV